MADADKLKFALDRIAVLESLVDGLIRLAMRDHPKIADNLIAPWKGHIANWPDVEKSLTHDTVRLVETVRALRTAPVTEGST